MGLGQLPVSGIRNLYDGMGGRRLRWQFLYRWEVNSGTWRPAVAAGDPETQSPDYKITAR